MRYFSKTPSKKIFAILERLLVSMGGFLFINLASYVKFSCAIMIATKFMIAEKKHKFN